MITDLTVIPQVITLGTWETLLDIWKTSSRRKVKDLCRRVFITKTNNIYEITLEKRDNINIKKEISEGLWRIIPGYGEWRQILNLQVTGEFATFSYNNFNFEVQTSEVSSLQVLFGITYEQRNVFAEQIGSITPAVEIPESWHYPENGASGNSNRSGNRGRRRNS